MANYVPTKCVFRSSKKEFFEQWQKDKELIDDNLYEYLEKSSKDLYEEYKIEDSPFTFDTDIELPPESIITTYENYTEAELWYSGKWGPAPQAAYCLAEILAQKAGINTIEVQIIFTICFAEELEYVLTTDPAFKDKILISLFSDDDTHLFDEIDKDIFKEDYGIKKFYNPNRFITPSEMLKIIKKIIKDNNLQGYENLGKDYKYKYTSTQRKYLGREPSDELLSLFDFQSRYNSDEQEITFNFLIYIDELPTKDPDFYHINSLKFAGAESYFQLGKKLYLGDDIEQNVEEAEKMFCKAVENGYDKFKIAEFYCEEDEEKACEWFKLSAQEGNAEAQYVLGVRYECGDGVEENAEESIKYYKLSAEQGYPEAKIELGFCYYYGVDGIEQDDEEAYKLIKEALNDGYDLDELLDQITDRSSDEDINQIIRNFEFLARFDYVDSTIANLYFNCAKYFDEDDAIVCYTYAAKYGHPEAHKKIEELKKKK